MGYLPNDEELLDRFEIAIRGYVRRQYADALDLMVNAMRAAAGEGGAEHPAAMRMVEVMSNAARNYREKMRMEPDRREDGLYEVLAAAVMEHRRFYPQHPVDTTG